MAALAASICPRTQTLCRKTHIPDIQLGQYDPLWFLSSEQVQTLYIETQNLITLDIDCFCLLFTFVSQKETNVLQNERLGIVSKNFWMIFLKKFSFYRGSAASQLSKNWLSHSFTGRS